jgi:hypothetical protein
MLFERTFPTEVRSTASGFCYHIGTVFGGLVPPIISYSAVEQHLANSPRSAWANPSRIAARGCSSRGARMHRHSPWK